MAELLADKNDISIKVVVFDGKDKNKLNLEMSTEIKAL